jgi:hypothetical protein
MSEKKRPKYTKEFKQDAIKLLLNSGIAARRLAGDLALPLPIFPAGRAGAKSEPAAYLKHHLAIAGMKNSPFEETAITTIF